MLIVMAVFLLMGFMKNLYKKYPDWIGGPVGIEEYI
jgi:hypothetical protein